MFSEQRGVWGEKPSYKTFPPQKRSPTATTALLIWSWDGTSTILTSVQLLHKIVGHLLHLSQNLKIWTNLNLTPPFNSIRAGIPNLIFFDIDYKSHCLQNGTESHIRIGST